MKEQLRFLSSINYFRSVCSRLRRESRLRELDTGTFRLIDSLEFGFSQVPLLEGFDTIYSN